MHCTRICTIYTSSALQCSRLRIPIDTRHMITIRGERAGMYLMPSRCAYIVTKINLKTTYALSMASIGNSGIVLTTVLYLRFLSTMNTH